MNKFKKIMSGLALVSALSLVFTANAEAKEYVVKKGDTLYSIARKNGTTVLKIIQDNKISSILIKPGQVLNIGEAPLIADAVDGKHVVSQGDTLYSIAKKNGLTLDELKKINNLTSNYVPVGRVLSVVKTEVAMPKADEEKTTKTAPKPEVATSTKKVQTTEVPKTTKIESKLKEVTTTKKAETTAKAVVTTKATPKPVTVTTTKKVQTTEKAAVTTKAVPKAVEVTTTKKTETTKKPEVTTTTKKETTKPTPTTTTKKVANVPGATFKDKADQELWNKVANNYKTDPSVAGLQPRVAQMKQFLGTKFGVKDFSLYRPGDNDGTGHGHGDGLAIDLMVPVGGAKGDQISDYLVKNYDGLGIYYLIWKQQFYMNQNNIYGPANTWNWMPDRGGVTANHYDHVHISFEK